MNNKILTEEGLILSGSYCFYEAFGQKLKRKGGGRSKIIALRIQ